MRQLRLLTRPSKISALFGYLIWLQSPVISFYIILTRSFLPGSPAHLALPSYQITKLASSLSIYLSIYSFLTSLPKLGGQSKNGKQS